MTSAFLHSRDGLLVVLHPLFNMLWLYIIGKELEPRVGSAPFAALYLTAAIGGSTAAHLAGQGGVGASGAVFGLSMPLWVGPMWGRIGWEAHLGGLAAGMLVGFCWAVVSPRAAGLRTASAAAVGGLCFALVLSGAALPVDTVEAGWVPDEEDATEQELGQSSRSTASAKPGSIDERSVSARV